VLYRALFLFVFAVAVLPAAAGKPAKGGVFDRLRTAVAGAGWVEQKDALKTFTAQELYGIIDGGATTYEQQGLKSGVLVSFKNGGKVVEMFLDDFGKPALARGMVAEKKKLMSEPKDLPATGKSPAFYDAVLGGCLACWAAGPCYIEMSLTGYDAPEKAAADAAALIEALSHVVKQ
jgi:hypothetical protein